MVEGLRCAETQITDSDENDQQKEDKGLPLGSLRDADEPLPHGDVGDLGRRGGRAGPPDDG